MASITASAFTVIPYAFPSFFFFRKDSFVFALINFFFPSIELKLSSTVLILKALKDTQLLSLL